MGRLVAILISFLCANIAGAAELPHLNINANRIAVTGVSSGGIMAVQLGVAHSATFRGVGVFAGGIYGCADKNITHSGNCLRKPEDPQSIVKSYLAYKHSLHMIDAPANIAKQRIYLFFGTEDKIVSAATMQSLAKFYELFDAGPNIKFNVVKAGHGQPTLHPSNPCTSSGSPWLINCGFSGAHRALEHFFGPLHSEVSAVPNRLTRFDQSLYATPEAGMSKHGLIYIPEKCREGASCGLIVSLHGCGQSPETLGPVYATKAGYNEMAEANDFVILYPAVHPGWIYNRAGCWDWWGYTGKKMTDKQGPQIHAIMNMVDRVRGR